MTSVMTVNYFLTAGTLLSAFKRTENELHWSLATHEDDELTDFIRSLHDGELPNDWRYDIIHWIIAAIASEDLERGDDWSDKPYEYAEYLTDQINPILLQWYADYPSRLGYVEEGISEGMISKDQDVISQLMAGQHAAIHDMASTILFKLNLN